MTIAFRLGSIVQDSATGFKTLSAGPTGANNYETMESDRSGAGAGGGTDYQVPAGRTFTIAKIIYRGENAGADFMIGYGDDAVANGVAAPTNPVGLTADGVFAAPTAHTTYSVDVYLVVPAEKYPYVKVSGTTWCNIIALGYEV